MNIVTTVLNNGAVVLAKAPGDPFQFVNYSQASRKVQALHEAGVDSFVSRFCGRVFYAVIYTRKEK